MSAAVEVLVDARAALGECPLWCERSRSLTWTDIDSATLTRWHEADGSVREWKLPERVGSFALCEGGAPSGASPRDVSMPGSSMPGATMPGASPRGAPMPGASTLLLGLASGVALFDLETETLGAITPIEADNPATRINDGRCDRQGRFVFGMYAAGRDAAPGHFYRVDAGGAGGSRADGKLRVERLPLPPAAVANSIAFSPDGSRLYFTDTPTRRILCCDYFADGRIGTPRLFVRVPDAEGFPDGSTVDAEGGLWNAQWRGRCVVRYDTEGRVTDRIELPASQITCPAFGGANLERLFATSARGGLSDDALRSEPQAGGVFAALAGRRGLPEQRFKTDRRP